MNRLLLVLATVGIAVCVSTVHCVAQGQIDSIWTETPNALPPGSGAEPPFTPASYRVFEVNWGVLAARLANAPMEFTAEAQSSPVSLHLPYPDGAMKEFALVESPVLAQDVQTQHPEIRTYSGRGVTDRSATCRVSVTPSGLHGFILSGQGVVFLDPVSRSAPGTIISYHSDDPGLASLNAEIPECLGGPEIDTTMQRPGGGPPRAPTSHGSELRIFRLAACAAAPYTMYHSGPGVISRDSALVGIAVAMNRINAIFEREVAVRMVLVGGDSLISTDLADFSCLDANHYSEIHRWLGRNIDTAAYDLAHLFTGGKDAYWVLPDYPCSGAGGWGTGLVCTVGRYRGYSGSPTPEGDIYYLLTLAHELGHQFSASHTHNSGTCGDRTAESAFEPGCGSTLMAYTNRGGASIALQFLSDPYFHRASLDQIISWTVQHAPCAQIVSTGNTPPVVQSVTPSRYIPIGTPFALTCTASDSDQDSLTYCWEQDDLGPSGLPDTPSGNAPIFRSFPPTASPIRTFPSLFDILFNAHTLGELLPSYERVLHFTMTVRDNRGGTAFDTMMLAVTGQAGPFRVTRPDSNVVLQPGGTYEVAWDVANTDAAPVLCTDVRILLSVDGGFTFPYSLAAFTANDGSQVVDIPSGISTYRARIKVEAVGNAFFAISKTDCCILSSPTYASVLLDQKKDGDTVSVGTIGRWMGTPDLQEVHAGQSVSMLVGSTEVIRSTDSVLDNQKFHRWNDDPGQIVSSRSLVVDTDQEPQTSYLLPTTTDVTMRLRCVDAAGLRPNGLSAFAFRDPWLDDLRERPYRKLSNRGMDAAVFRNQGSVFSPNAALFPTEAPRDTLRYKGVFRNQGYPNWDPPYYSLACREMVKYVSKNPYYDGRFVQWVVDQGDAVLRDPFSAQTDIVFRSAGTVISCLHKGWMYSSGPLQSNSQRKLLQDGSRFFFAYNSGGYSWITRKGPEAGDPWTYETRLDFTKDAPVSIDAGGGQLFATAATNQYWELFRLDPDSLRTIRTLRFPVAQDDTVRQAVVAKQTTSDMIVVAASRARQGGSADIALYAVDVSSASAAVVHDSASLGAFVGIPVNPTLVCDRSGAFHIAWQEADYIWYRRFLVDGNGHIDSLDLAPDQISNCATIFRGEKPSITVDAENHPHIVWETPRRAIDLEAWPQPDPVLYGRVIGYRTKNKPFSNPASAASWSRELLFEVKNRLSYNPVIGNDRFAGERLRVVWESGNGGGRVHTAIADLQHAPPYHSAWRRKTLPDTGMTPVIALDAGTPLGLFAQPLIVSLDTLQKFFWSQDTGRFDFLVHSGDSQVELRGGEVRNEHFTIGLAIGVYEDSATGMYQPFVSVEDSVRISALAEIPQVVRTTPFDASHLRFDIRRHVHGFREGAPFEVFDNESVTWWAVIRNANNDTVVTSLKLGGVEKDSAYAGIDSGFVAFVHQPVYVQLVAEATPSVFPCYDWLTITTAPLKAPDNMAKAITQESLAAPATMLLHANVPNPFTTSTMISFGLDQARDVRLTVHDLMGREVAVLLQGPCSAGLHQTVWHGSDLPSGTYLLRLQAGPLIQTRAMTHIR